MLQPVQQAARNYVVALVLGGHEWLWLLVSKANMSKTAYQQGLLP